MTLFNQVLAQFNESERAIISRFWAAYQAKRIKSTEKPDSINQRAKALGISRQALWEREKREKAKG